MALPPPGTILDGAVVYRTVAGTSVLPPQVLQRIDASGYSDLDFAFGLASERGAPVVIGGTVEAPGIAYTDQSGGAASLTVASIDGQGANGFRFTDTSGALWTVLDAAPSGGVAADPVLDQVIARESGNPVLQLALEDLKGAVDQGTGSHPVVYPYNPLDASAPCFVRGTRIATARGEVAVDALVAGDRVCLADGGKAPVVWIGRRRVQVARHRDPRSVAPVRIAAGALGAGVPRRALRVSPDHALFLDGVLVPAGLLVDGKVVVREMVDVAEYFHVELPRHALLLAEGAPAESYLDTGNRGMFANAPIVAIEADFARGDGHGLCAEMVLDGERLAAIRDRIGTDGMRRAS